MKDVWKQWTAKVPAPFLMALLLAAGFMVFVGWDHSHWWSTREDYGFGWLVPAFVAFVVYDRWGRIEAALRTCAAPQSPRMAGAGRAVFNLVVGGALVGGALLFLLGAFYRAGAGPSLPGSQALAIGTAALLLPLLLINAPETSQTVRSGVFADARVRLVALFVFPCCVWLVSAPLVSVIENQLSLFLLNKVMAVVFFCFDTLGLPLQQEGNTLLLPPVLPGVQNRVGVEQACSGIRSLTACIFAGSFLATVFLDKLWKKVALVVSSMLFAVFTNLLRSLFLTSWAYAHGHEAIEGSVHDVAGYAVLGLTVLGLLALLPLFNLQFSGEGDSGDGEEPVTA